MFDTIMIHRAYKESIPRQVRDTFIRKADRYVKPSSDTGSLLSLNRTVPSLSWSDKPNGVSYLTATVSLPKLLHGTNTILLSESDIARALGVLSEYTSQAAGIEFDATSANVGRMDICHNFQVGEADTYAYLGALRDAKIPYLSRRCFDSTVDFVNRSGAPVVSVYAKYAETLKQAKRGKASDKDVERSRGVLRLERRFLNGGACKEVAKRLPLRDRSAASLLQRVVYDTVMNVTIKELGLDEVIENGDKRLDFLLARYGMTAKYKQLAGFLALCDKHGADNLIRLGYKKQTFYRERKEVIEAGAWLASTRLLPPLRLVRSNLVSVAA
jgi:hypothetical protein